MPDVIDEAVIAADNKIEGAVGIRPVGAVKRVVDKVMPANVVHEATGIPKPDSVLGDIQNKVESDLGRIVR